MSFIEYLKEGFNKVVVDVDYMCDDPKECAKLAKKHKVKIKVTGNTTADVSGDKINVIQWMMAAGYGDDALEIIDMYSELQKVITPDEASRIKWNKK